MNRKSLILFLLLLAAAGVLGWFLPVLAAGSTDRSLEGSPEPVSVRQVDLRYQFDLSTADRLRLVREGRTEAEMTPLERGIYLTEREARSVVVRFLRELTGTSFDLNETQCSAEPALLRFREEGSVVVWTVTAVLNNSWRCVALLDDQTGLLLHCVISGAPYLWELLFPEAEGWDLPADLCSALGSALRAHFARQLTADFTVSMEPEAATFPGGWGEFLLTEAGGETIRVPFLLIPEEGCLEINQ